MLDRKIRPEDHQLASQDYPSDDTVIKRDRFFYPILTQIMDSFCLHTIKCGIFIFKKLCDT